MNTCMHSHTYVFFLASVWQKPQPSFEMSELKYNPPKEFAMLISNLVHNTGPKMVILVTDR